MDLDQTLLADSWLELEALENETKLLLESVRAKPKVKAAAKAPEPKAKPVKKTKEPVKKGKKRKPEHVYDSRTTIEILDDASPDATPRIDEESDNYKRVQAAQKKLAVMQVAESQFRQMQFPDETARVAGNADTFVPGPDTTAADVRREQARLARLEDSARALNRSILAEASGQRAYLQQDRSALKMQAMFRGHIGRQKYAVTHKLQTMLDEDEFGGWVEVNDPDSGDQWYYNQSNGRSQWARPSALDAEGMGKGMGMGGGSEKLPRIADTHGAPSPKLKRSGSVTFGKDKEGERRLQVSMSLPSLEAVSLGRAAGSQAADATANFNRHGDEEQEDARAQVNTLLGIDRFGKPAALTAPDGSFKPHLRTVVLDALLDTRFDSVSAVLSDPRWYEADEDLNNHNNTKNPPQDTGKGYKALSEDLSRAPLVSQLTFNKKKAKRGRALEASDKQTLYSATGTGMGTGMGTGRPGSPSWESEELASTKDLTFKQVEHVGFETTPSADIMCFGCWSAGVQRRCEMHEGGGKLKPSQTMLLCRNWDLDVMRRRYRSEEIQELWLAKESSLRFDAKHKRFSTVTEQRHPVYRTRAHLNNLFNTRMVLFEKVKRWLFSMAEELRMGQHLPPTAAEMSAFMRLRRNIVHSAKLQRFTRVNQGLLPVAPITGYSWPERQGLIQYLFKHVDAALAQEVDLILSYPLPAHQFLYKPREYHLPLARTIPMPQPSYSDEVRVMPSNCIIPDNHNAAWLESLSAAVAREVVTAARSQVNAFTPLSQTSLVGRTKNPPPNTVKSATLGRKPAPGNMAVGGLALELLIYQLICTYIPTQYGNFMVMDKAAVSPGISAEVNISFASIVMPPILQHHVLRALEHPLNYRRSPTITLNSCSQPDEGHFYGVNRPEQTGEQDYHGFRTTCWAPMLLTYVETDPQVFVPGQNVVSLNTPKANTSITTHADYTYPFCEPSTRDNSTLDFYHLLLTGVVAPNKAQVFTALTVQEPGGFMKAYNANLPLGHLVVAVYRSWAFTQRDTIQQFATDDGVPYWYHRKTGQTFWERPLYEDEEDSPLLGGTILDHVHAEEPSTLSKGEEGAGRRYLQGEFREQMLKHIETPKDAHARRKSAMVTVMHAKQRGVIPALEGMESLANNAMESAELPSHFDLSRQLGSSLLNTASSNGVGVMGTGGIAMGDMLELGDPVDDPGPTSPLSGYGGSPSRPGMGMGIGMGGQGQGGQGQGFSRPPTAALGSHLDEPSMLQPSMQQSRAQSMGTPGGMVGGGTGGGMGMGGGMGGGATSNFPGIDPSTVNNLSSMIGSMMHNMMLMDHNDPQSMVQMGMGMAMALMASGAVQGVVGGQLDAQRPINTPEEEALQGMRGSMSEAQVNSALANDARELGVFPSIGEEEASVLSNSQDERSHISRVSVANPTSMLNNKGQPIGKVNPTEIFSADKVLDHTEEVQQIEDVAHRLQQPLNTHEHARGLRINVTATETPDIAPAKLLTHVKASNAEDGLRETKKMPVLAYPELSTTLPNGAPVPFHMQKPAGEGTSFVTREEEMTQRTVPGAAHLNRTVMPLPVGFFEAIEAKHVAQQTVDYLPQVPNLPQSRNIGRVKPRSAAADWLMIHFDPWSAGKNPLSTEFVPSLMEKAEQFVEGGPARAADAFDQLRQQAMQGAFVTIEDEAGLAEQRAEVSKAEHLTNDFKHICSMCRHSKFSDAEQMMNQPDWNVPIDFQDDQGNSLLHVVAQNGSRRMVKLCLRRGAQLDLQNLTGQTALHFAFGYGYADVGDYLVQKGADDSVRNKDGLTCYEGLGAKELEFL